MDTEEVQNKLLRIVESVLYQNQGKSLNLPTLNYGNRKKNEL